MKILWVVNIMLPPAAKKIGIEKSNIGGWLYAYLKLLSQTENNFIVVCPCETVLEATMVEDENVLYYILPKEKMVKPEFEKIISKHKPDVIHIHGTELEHSFQMALAAGNTPCVASVQGLISRCHVHFMDGIPSKYNNFVFLKKVATRLFNVVKLYPFYMILEKQKFEKAAVLENKTLLLINNVIGRTHWDEKHTKLLNEKVNYFKVNEILRDEFYTDEKWMFENCEKHSIFITQASYPIKGFHQLLKILPKLVEAYPNIKVYIAGKEPITTNNKILDVVLDLFFDYQAYLKKLIKKGKLEEYIFYVGPLTALQMKEKFLKSNIFLSCSTIENSPNSVGEAMMLSVPVVASNVGGTATMLTDKKDGLLYDFYDEEQMFENICALFDDEKLAKELGASAKNHATITHDKHKNSKDLIAVYEELLTKK